VETQVEAVLMASPYNGHMTQVPEQVSVLVREVQEIFGGRLQSLVAYALHARAVGHAGQHGPHDEFARTQTLAIVQTLTREDLTKCAGHIADWQTRGLATPLFLAAHEFERSLDAFPLEFGTILADHVVVFGKNPFEGLAVNAADVRRACEVQARSHLLHLREGFLEARGRADALSVLVVRSAAPFSALLTSLARLEGVSPRDPAAAGRHAERTLQLTPGSVTDVVKLVDVDEISSAEATRLFPAYFDAVERLVKYVDGWSAR
jgi:hypothetical protein